MLRKALLCIALSLSIAVSHAGPNPASPDAGILEQLRRLNQEDRISDALLGDAPDWLAWARETENTQVSLMLKWLAEGRITEEEFADATAEVTEEFQLHQVEQAWNRWLFAMMVAQHGIETDSVDALVLAARLLAAEGVYPAAYSKRTDGDLGTNLPKEPPIVEPSDLLARAVEVAEGSPALEGFVAHYQRAEVQQASRRMALHHDVIAGGATDTYSVAFQGNRPALVLVFGDGDTDLDLFIYDESDESDEAIDTDEDLTDRCVCWWVPHTTGPFRIEVENFGDEANAYTLVTNEAVSGGGGE